MFEFLLFIAACAAIAFLVANIQKHAVQSKETLKPIKIKREEKMRRSAHRQKRHY
ncbi:MAG: Flp pilus assembly protein TadB [Oceanicoccus sp.]|jgi:Flp pilus assembly protein TadB